MKMLPTGQDTAGGALCSTATNTTTTTTTITITITTSSSSSSSVHSKWTDGEG